MSLETISKRKCIELFNRYNSALLDIFNIDCENMSDGKNDTRFIKSFNNALTKFNNNWNTGIYYIDDNTDIFKTVYTNINEGVVVFEYIDNKTLEEIETALLIKDENGVKHTIYHESVNNVLFVVSKWYNDFKIYGQIKIYRLNV